MLTSSSARLIGLLLCVLAIGGLSAAPTQAQNRETLVLALLSSAAENDLVSSRHFVQGAQLALEIVNGGGGVRGPARPADNATPVPNARRTTLYTFSLQTRSAATQTEMRTALQASVEAKPIALIGPQVPSLLDNNLDLANTNRILHLVGLPSEPAGVSNPFILRMRSSNENLARDLGNYLTTQRYFRVIGTAADNSARGRADLAAFERAARPPGTTTVRLAPAVTYDQTATDLTTQARTLYDDNPEAIAIFGTPQTAAALVRELRNRGYTGVIAYGSAEGNLSEFIKRGGSAVANVIVPLIWLADAQDGGSQRFVEVYRARFGELPTSESVIGFDSVAAVAAAVEISGGGTQAVRDTLVTSGAIGGLQGVYNPSLFSGTGTTNFRAIDAAIFFRLTAEGKGIEESRYSGGFCSRRCASTRFQNLTAPNAPTAIATRTVPIVFLAPQTGLDGEIGRRALRGAQLAINEINSQGGIAAPNGTRVTLDLRDFNTTSAEQFGVTARSLLTTAPPAAILGPTLTGIALPNLNLAPNARVPQFVTGTAAVLSNSDPTRFIFQLRPADATWAAALASYLVDIRGYTRLAVAAATTVYGQDSVAAFTQIVTRFRDLTDAQVVASTSHPITATDLTAEAQLLIAAQPEAIAIWSAPGAAAALIKALRDQGFTGEIAYGALENPDFQSALGDEGMNGLLGVTSWFAGAQDAASAEFVRNYRATYGELPDSHAVAYYDAVYMIANAIKNGGPAAVQPFVAQLPRFAGVQGEYRPAVYNNGQLSATVFIVRADAQGNLSELARYEGAVCINGCR
ncbi:MAG: ABC transporter substrate-binding protein [Aggregatilineales bacterium]